MLVKRHQR